MKRRDILLSSCALLATMSCSKPEETKLNVIYILADDLGYGDLGCYGQEKIKTPNIDRMAEQGMLFTNHYAGCTVSAPSRCSLMTGLHTGHSQIRGNKELYPEGQQPMQEGTYTIASLMKDEGYTTGIFGKWGLGYPRSVSTPNAMGFDEFYGYNCQRQAHTYYPEHLWHNNDSISIPENLNNGRTVFSQDLIHEKALNFIRENSDKPFFAMLTYTLPHAVYASWHRWLLPVLLFSQKLSNQLHCCYLNALGNERRNFGWLSCSNLQLQKFPDEAPFCWLQRS